MFVIRCLFYWRAKVLHYLSVTFLQSTEALEFMKRDLAEFTQVVQHDTACTIAATASVVKDKLARTEGSSGATEKVRKGLSDFLGVISDTFAPSPDKTIDCDVLTLMATPTGTTEPYDSAKARLYSLQSDPATYCNEPDGMWGSVVLLSQAGPCVRSVGHPELPRAFDRWPCCLDCGWGLSALGTAPEGNHPTAPKGPSEESWAVLPPEPALAERSPSESSESVSPVTQIANPASVPAAQLQTGAQPAGTGDLSQRLLEATSEEQSSPPKPPEPAHPSATARESAASSEQPAVTEPKDMESKAQGRTETLKEEGPTDLRVFELNSDSGKSTPSNNGKKGSSTDISEDWEKDFDLDMTEEEVQLALSKVEVSGELEDEEWEDWE
ncbi:BSDC1 protein, partial [Columbina picui]|nr:BSDC1 protein [Columbina picui]